MRNKELDIALLGPYSYITAHDSAGARAFASPENQRTGSTYNSLIITHAGNGIETLAQLKGRSFSFVDRDSTSGYLIPKVALLKQGIDPGRDFSQGIFSGHHDAAVLAVKRRTVDAAAVSSNVLKNLLEKGVVDEKEIRVLFASSPIPQSVWAYREGISADIAGRIAQAFFNVHLEKGALGVYEKDVVRFVPREDDAYEIIRETAKQLKKKKQ